jgi:hypothetical protein
MRKDFQRLIRENEHGDTKMRLHWILGSLLATTLTISAAAQLSVYIGHPPPPIRYEQRGAIPGPGYAWVDGYWSPQGQHYRWVQGRWGRPPYEGAYSNHPHYDHQRQGWQLHEGHWDRDDHGRDHDHDHGH